MAESDEVGDHWEIQFLVVYIQLESRSRSFQEGRRERDALAPETNFRPFAIFLTSTTTIIIIIINNELVACIAERGVLDILEEVVDGGGCG